MQCLSCDRVLDRYIEGTLKPPLMAAVTQHLRGCERCSALWQELKVVDALLETTRPAPLPENFTFAVMAETSDLPVPVRRHHRVWSFLVLYVVAAWVAALIAAAVAGPRAPAFLSAMLSFVTASAGRAAGSIDAAAAGVGTVLPPLAALGAGIFAIDLALGAAFCIFYFFIRPRVAARLAASEVRS